MKENNIIYKEYFMFKKIMGAAVVSMVATQAVASHQVKCTSGAEAVSAVNAGYVCEGDKLTCMTSSDVVIAALLNYSCDYASQKPAPKPTPKPEPKAEGKSLITLQREQVQCKIELKKQCGSKIEMEPLYDSGCIIGKEKAYNHVLGSFEETNYLAYYNLRHKLVTVVDVSKCSSNSTYVAGKLSQAESFDNKLFLVVNGKPVFVDSYGKYQEVLASWGSSYAEDGSYVKELAPSVDGKTLKIVVAEKQSDRVYSQNISASDLKYSRRLKEVAPSKYVEADAKVIGTKADVIR